ncbi:TldD/PmbA family protein [candidate division WOR-3 bacterium]|nr:TldD/PmbA family protein [candidate division WOR-3 bacterium]
MKQFLQGVLAGLDVDHAEIRVEETETTTVAYRGRELDSIGRSFERGGCLRVFHRGNWTVGTFNRVDESLNDLARDLAVQVETLPERDDGLAPLGSAEETVALDPSEDPAQVGLDEKHDLIRHYNDILLAAPGIVSTNAVYHDARGRVALYTTEDRYVDREFGRAGFRVAAIAKDGTDIQSFHDGFGKTGSFRALAGREALVERVARRARELLKAEPVKAGRYRVVLDQELAGVFVHEAFGHLSEADFLADNERLRGLMATGTRYGTDELTIVDDASLPGERGSYRFDDEGCPGTRTELVREGVLVGHLHDRQTARAMGEPVTGNARAVSYRHAPIVRMSNTWIEPRAAVLEELFDACEGGLYVCGSRGGMTELESFTFSSQYAQVIEGGRPTRLVRDATLSGNVFETLGNIELVGDDLVMFGGLGGCGKSGQAPLPVGLGAPHLLVRDVVIGGR